MSSRVLFRPWIRNWRGRSVSDAMRRLEAALRAGALLLVFVLAGVQAAAAEKRVALVIGNSAYQGLKPLQNPANDAGDMSAALRTRGFEVLTGIDLGQQAMTDLVTRFRQAARESDVSLFYYAGHGFQVSLKNYLVPVDAAFAKPEDVAQRTMDLDSIVEGLEGSRGIHLVFLDACRNNPLRGAVAAAGELQNGLARIGSAAGFLFAYATRPDNIAFDGGGRNSPFTKALLSHIGTRGQDIAGTMISVRKDVLAATGGFQVPWENSSLTRQFYFTPGAASVASPETQLWQLAAGARDKSLLGIYLDRYPDGAHAGEVRTMLAEAEAAGPPGNQGSARSTPADPASDDRLWDLAQRSRMRSLVEYYLSRGSGRHVTEARELLERLPESDDANAAPEQVCERLATHPRDATANASGVPLAELARNANVALAACEKARIAHPEMPLYGALLARTMAAAGRRADAVRLYREAAEGGNLRAMVSLGLILETGDGVPKDIRAAMSLYERAAAAGSPDGAINLAVALMGGVGVPKDVRRAVGLLAGAAEAGSAIATYNLGVLAQQGVTSTPAQALDYFRKAAELGDPRGYLPAAILLDEGRGVPKDRSAAAEMLLRGVASDAGEALNQITLSSTSWSPETIKAVQNRLRRSGHYNGPVDGRGGPGLGAALRNWRRFGNLDASATR